MRVVLCVFTLLLSSSLLWASKADIDTLHNQAYELLDSDPDKALELSKQAETLAHDGGHDFLEANSLFIQAYLYRHKFDELGKAFVINLKALELLRPLEEEKAIKTYANILVNTGEILKQHYAYPEAVQYYDEGISIAIKHDLINTLMMLYYNKAVALRHNGDFDYAIETIDKAISLATKEKDEYKLISAINEKGIIQKDQGLYQSARQSYQRIIDYEFEKLKPAKYIGRAWHNTGVTFQEEKDYPKALNAFRKAETYHTERPKSSDQFTTWLSLGEVHYYLEQYDEALKTGRKAEAIYDEVSLLPDHYELFDLLSKICHSKENHEEAYQYSQQYVTVNKSFLTAQEEILRVKDQYKMEVLTAGFFQEIRSEEAKRKLKLYLIVCSAFFLIVLFVRHLRWLNIKKAVSQEIKKIESFIFFRFFFSLIKSF